jgi:N-methylhydantoinase A
MDEHEAAQAVLKVANANMADAVRLISIRRGLDPRDFALVVFGGAGPLHGAELARELSIPTVIVPPNPGITSALGCLLVDVRHDLETMHLVQAAHADVARMEAEFVALEEEARERMRAEGVSDADVALQRRISMRYVGQWRSLAVEVEGPITSLDAAIARFHAEHKREYTYSREDAPVEIYQLQLQATGLTPKPDLAREEPEPHRPEPYASRDVVFDDPAPVRTGLFRRGELRAGAEIDGPAIIEQLDSTIVVPPGVTAEVDEYLMIRMTVPMEVQA